MTDLSSPEIQATFKNNKLAVILTNVAMAILALLSAGLAIWVAVEKTRLKLTDWSVWVFVALLGVIALLFVFIIVWEVFFKRPYRRIVHRYIADNFNEHTAILQAKGNAEFELCIAGDKLALFRQGCEDFVQFDMTYIKKYPNVCIYAEGLIKRYLTDYYALNGDMLEVKEVILADKVHGRAKVKRLLTAEKCVKNLKNSFFISSGMIESLSIATGESLSGKTVK
ncbi:MAG: hypothetical protein ACI4VK_03015 [Candidatus Coproplasma sp.]